MSHQALLDMQRWNKSQGSCSIAAPPLPWGRKPYFKRSLPSSKGSLSHVILTNAKLVANTSSNVYTALAGTCKGAYKQLPLCWKLQRLGHPQEVTRLRYIQTQCLSWLILAPSMCPLLEPFQQLLKLSILLVAVSQIRTLFFSIWPQNCDENALWKCECSA